MTNTEAASLGFCMATVLWLVVIVLAGKQAKHNEESGYVDKMIITYHCPGKEYQRGLFREVLDKSGIQTNFTNKVTTMDKHKVRIRMTNPKVNDEMEY